MVNERRDKREEKKRLGFTKTLKRNYKQKKGSSSKERIKHT